MDHYWLVVEEAEEENRPEATQALGWIELEEPTASNATIRGRSKRRDHSNYLDRY